LAPSFVSDARTPVSAGEPAIASPSTVATADPHILAGRGAGGALVAVIVSEALACGEEAEPVRLELARLRQATVIALRERFDRAVRDGDLPGGPDCATLARYVATVLNGLAVQAASGATEKELRLASAMGMRGWPS
jgi:hypothetical protein